MTTQMVVKQDLYACRMLLQSSCRKIESNHLDSQLALTSMRDMIDRLTKVHDKL